MVIAFGEVTKVTDLPDGGMLIERTSVRDYKTQRQKLYYAEQVRVNDYKAVREHIDELISRAEAGECLDISIELVIDKDTKLPKLMTKTALDIGSKL